MSNPSLPVLHTEGMVREMALHPGLPLIVSSPRIPLEVPDTARTAVRHPRRLSAFLFFWVIEGNSVHNVDMETVRLESGQLLFVQPNQIHQSLSDWKQARDWYKIAFESDCLSLLPHTYDFLLNPLHAPVLFPGKEERVRMTATFESIAQILAQGRLQSLDLILAHLNVLLTELNDCYFRQSPGTRLNRDGSFDTYLAFKRLVERDVRLQPSIRQLALELSVSENRLYKIVRHFSGLSPKGCLLKRTLLEAQRIFYYDRSPVKEVAYELGFSDPNHFSRIFRNGTGKTPTAFLQEVQDLYSK